MSPDKADSAIFIGINKVVAKGLEEVGEEEEEEEHGVQGEGNSNNSATNRTTIYPCKVLNRFECPYENGKKIPGNTKFDVDDLFALDEIAFLAELAFGQAESMTRSNETIYEADFQSGKVKGLLW